MNVVLLFYDMGKIRYYFNKIKEGKLKDKLMKTELPRHTSTTLPQSQAMCDAQSIMLSLGYEDKEIEDALLKVVSTIEDDSNPEEILRKALTCLSM